LERLGQSSGAESDISRDEAFEQLKKRETELERLNEVQTNLAISFYPNEEEIDQCLIKWISGGLSQKFRTLLENEGLKDRLLSKDTEVFDTAYYEVLELLKADHNEKNTN
jgi:hypothetical protein